MLFMIGGHKCGTTFFHYLLTQHPKIKEGHTKEVEYYHYRYGRGFEWYKKQFKQGDHLNIDSSTGYLQFPLAAYRVKKDFPKAKILALLRNPVDRAYSHYCQKIYEKREPLSFENAIKAECQRSTVGQFYYFNYLDRGLYADKLPVWIDLFDDVMILKAEDMFKDPIVTANNVLKWLNLEPIELSSAVAANVTKKKYPNRINEKWPDMKPKTRTMLEKFYAPHNERLKKLVGFSW